MRKSKDDTSRTTTSNKSTSRDVIRDCRYKRTWDRDMLDKMKRLLERPEFVGLTKRGQERRWKLLEAAYNDNLKKGEQGYKTASQLKNIVMDTFLEGLRPYEDGEDDTLRDMFLNGEIPDCPAKRYQKLCPLTGKEVTAWQLLSDDWFHLLKSSPSSNAIKNKFNSQYNESNRKPRRRDPPAGGSDNLTSKRRKLESPNGQAKAGLKVQAAPDGSATNVYFQDSDGSSQAGRAATHFEANASDEDIQTGAGFGLHASSSAEDAGEQDEVDSCSLTLGISEALNTSTPALSSLDEVDITIRGQVYHPLTNVRKPLPRFGGENTLMVQPLGTAACCSPSPFKTVYSEDNPMSASPDGIRQQTQSHLVPPRRSRISPRFFGYSDDEEGVSQNAMMASPSPAAARDDESSFLDPLLEEPSSEEAELLGRHMSVSRLTY